MAKLKVICNMIDKNTGVVRYAGDVFEVNDANRIKELLNAKVVEEIKENNSNRQFEIVFFYCPKTYDIKRWDSLTDFNWRYL